jgi:hypothetical protein
MIETQTQSLSPGESWNPAPSRAAGLYGELQPLPLPVVASPESFTTPEPSPKSGPASS